MSWIILFFAGLFEVGWAVGLKYTEGFSKPLPTVLTALAMLVSLGLLGLAMKHLPLGTASCRLDRGRRGRHGNRRDRPVRRIHGIAAPGQRRADRLRTGRPQAEPLDIHRICSEGYRFPQFYRVLCDHCACLGHSES